ncbi:MAG: hypothetical protein BWY80_01297 [Firmicutes bacterium ADurb.Bin456]|nr:MAG: hypothetical protein BWY80_01297 [Firmicutes bacterium ADurb.Bin456]
MNQKFFNVPRYPYVPYQAFLFGLNQGGQGAVRAQDPVQIIFAFDIVQLIQVDMVQAHGFKADLNICGHGFPCSGHGLGGDDSFVSPGL